MAVTEKDIGELLGAYLERIGDRGLRELVVKAWVLACQKAGLKTASELKAMPFTLLTDARGINFVEHTLAVTGGALGLYEAQRQHYAALPYPVNVDRLIAGGLLHDVGKILEIERGPDAKFRQSRSGKCARHPVSGAILAAQAGLPDEVVNIIVCHAKEGEGRPQVVEAVLIHQADFGTFDPLVMMEKSLLIS